MELANDDVKKMSNLLKVCASLSIENILIEEGFARGVNEDKSCVFISQSNIPSFGTNKIGITRLGVLLSRMNLFANKNVKYNAKETEKGEISYIEISGSGAKIQFRCGQPSLIKAPKGVNDIPNWIVSIDQDQYEFISNSVKVMGAKRIMLILKDGKIQVECRDTNNDVFSITLNKDPEYVGEEEAPKSFVHVYPADVLLSAIKLNESKAEAVIGELGTFTLPVQDHPVTIIAQVE